MQNTSQPLINRTQILQDELLLSLLIRLTTLNFYELPVVLRGIVLEDPNTLSYFRDDLEFPLKSTTYEKLTSLTQLDIIPYTRLHCIVLLRFSHPLLTQ